MSDFCIYPHSGIPQGLKGLILVKNPLREPWFKIAKLHIYLCRIAKVKNDNANKNISASAKRETRLHFIS
jgi:hypothetical protein